MSTNGPLCSIIIPTYNHGKYIERCVQSALDQTYQDIEVIVVDDGSTDDTAERLTKFRNSVSYHYKENGGQGEARNVGIGLSRGQYLQFIDADDRLTRNKIERQIGFLIEDETIALVYSDCTGNDENGNDVGNISYALKEGEDPLPILLDRIISNINTCLVRRSAATDVGIFDGNRFSQEDWDFWLKLVIRGYKIKYLPETLSHYDQTGSGTVTNPELMYRRTQHMLEKYLNDDQFKKLGPKVVKTFTAYQSLHLANRAYSNRWWREARKYYLKAAAANSKLLNTAEWSCLAKTIIHQLRDGIRGKAEAIPPVER